MNARYRLLVLATRHAIPPDSGYATDTFGAIDQLRRLDVDVRVILLDDGKAHQTDYPESVLAGIVKMPRWKPFIALGEAVARGQPFVSCKWASPKIVTMATKLYAQWPFDLIQSSGSFHMTNALAIRQQCGAKVVMRAQNVEYAICQRMADTMKFGLQYLIWKREAVRLRDVEGDWCRAADLCLPISEDDRVLLQAMAPHTPMLTVQAGSAVTAGAQIPQLSVIKPHFLHMGSLDWPPRMEGLVWFLREVWPRVRSLIPGARLSIVGSISASGRAKLHPWINQGIEVCGFVENLQVVAEACAAVIIPMRCGGGIKIRLITAWANGWPAIGTSLMGEGLPAKNAINCLMADEPAELAEAMRCICADQSLRTRLIEAGREVHREHFSWETIGNQLLRAHELCLKIK